MASSRKAKTVKLLTKAACSLSALILAFVPVRAMESNNGISGTVPPWVSKAKKVGPADESKRVIITAYLAWRNPGELERLVQDQTTPGNQRYQQFLTPSEFHAAFSPAVEDVKAVEDELTILGFKIENVPDSPVRAGQRNCRVN